MYNILIVDDEYLARNKLHFMLDWNKYGFQIAGEACSAVEAIHFMNENAVDIIFADVYMPDMDGIQLAEYIHKNYPEISVVIFSNYSDFNYVKSAFSANVIDYILKYTLTEVSMQKTLEQIHEKRQNIAAHSEVLPSVIREREYRAQIKQAILSETSDLILNHAAIAVIGISNYKLSIQFYTAGEQEMLYQNFENIIATILAPVNGFVIFRQDSNLVLYLPFAQSKKETEIMNLVSSYIQQINTAIYKFFNLDLLWGISALSTPGYTIHQCFLEAHAMLINLPSKGKRSPFAPDTSVPCRLSISMEKNLLSAITDLNITKAEQCLEQIFAGITSVDNIDILVNDLTSIAAKLYNEFHIFTCEDITLPNRYHSSERYQEWAVELFRHIIESRLNMESIRYQTNYAHKAIEYISKNYSDETLSLSDIAKYVGISEQYLSKVFKKETCKNASAFLAEYRIERAKELLGKKDTNLKYLYADVGFRDNSYFCTVFKKYTECSPKEYQKRQLKKSEPSA